MLAFFGSNTRHGKPHHEHSKSLRQGVFSYLCLRKANVADIVITGLRGSAGIAGGSETPSLRPTTKSRRANSVAVTPAAWCHKRGERGKRPNDALMRRCKRKVSCRRSRGL